MVGICGLLGAPLQLAGVPGPIGHGTGWLAGCVVLVLVIAREAGKKRGVTAAVILALVE